MNAPKNPILIGIIAGLAAAVMLGAAAYASLFAVVLSIAAMASIFVAGLGFGLVACIVAVATAALASGLLYSNPMSAIGMALILMPAVVMSYLANLARPANELGGPDAAMAWYPLSDIMLAGAIVTALGVIATLFLQPDMDMLYVRTADLVAQMMTEIDPQVPVTADFKTQIVGVMRVMFPLAQSMQMLIALFAGFYVGLRILTAAGRSARPREDIRSSLRMNRLSIVVFLVGIALMFSSGKIQVIGACLAGAVAGGYLLSGVYLLTLIIWPLMVAIVVVGGLANPRRAIALTPNKPDQNPANPS
jgi:hypothetical protein